MVGGRRPAHRSHIVWASQLAKSSDQIRHGPCSTRIPDQCKLAIVPSTRVLASLLIPDRTR